MDFGRQNLCNFFAVIAVRRKGSCAPKLRHNGVGKRARRLFQMRRFILNPPAPVWSTPCQKRRLTPFQSRLTYACGNYRQRFLSVKFTNVPAADGIRGKATGVFAEIFCNCVCRNFSQALRLTAQFIPKEKQRGKFLAVFPLLKMLPEPVWSRCNF